ncbi:hypothetical protein B0T21DRAFT_348862 [Apiosordaria backusii]|uniref:Uncharacterized protein n=1 Tax=Apiosordaria backusii TaxID=314023 RepID=A0AA40BJH1_9PEZI|nr:hypothetical protein B0T21DRAFT_348862 [Apiosordaria backusii]
MKLFHEYECASAPGPDSCVQCISRFLENLSRGDLVLRDFSCEKYAVCGLQHPGFSGRTLGFDRCSGDMCFADIGKPCESIPLIMRGDAFDLQALVIFAHYCEGILPPFRKDLVKHVRDLLASFLLAVQETRAFERGSPDIFVGHVYQRRKLNAIQFPFPAKRINAEDLAAWESRKALRLLPGDAGFHGWRRAKVSLRDNLSELLCKPEIENLNISWGDYEGDDHEETIKAFLDAKYPPIMMGSRITESLALVSAGGTSTGGGAQFTGLGPGEKMGHSETSGTYLGYICREERQMAVA